MAFIDHDLHIHTELSSCSRDPDQNAAFLLKYAKTNGLTTICVTDHFWDETVPGASNWYMPQNYAHICALKKELPPSDSSLKILFGCECECDKLIVDPRLAALEEIRL